MDFELPEELKMVRQTVRRFVDQELMPLERSLDDLTDIPDPIRRQLEAKVKEMGFWAAAVPVEFGGGGIGALGNMVMREQISRCIVSDTRDDRGFGGSPWPILYQCDPEQRRKYLDPVIRGEKRHFFAMTEPGAGNDANGLATSAVLDGDEWAINGSKVFISHVDIADFGVVLAKTDVTKRARGGLSAFIVDKGTPGFNIVRMIHTIGAARVFELHFDNCRVPEQNLLGEVGHGFDIAGSNLTKTRLKQAASSLGLAQRALEMCIDYVQQRETFGKKLMDRGAVQMMIADSAAELRAARLMAYATSYRLDQGEDPVLEVAATKIYAGECGARILDRALQMHGGSGLTRDLPFERMVRDQRGYRITEGGAEVQRWVIARGLIKKYMSD
ncbi:MAG TPA: acyl-CoA dehydrogenase family protein [Chloroflexota bacterium]|nr:acyl-CoA dehydrogenase family protein [Chloroflexota bacterium]